MTKKYSIILATVLSFSCSGDGLYKDVQGIVKSATPNTFTVPSSPTPTISILGRSDNEFTVEYIDGTLDTAVANFIIRDVPQKNPVIFEIKHPTFDPLISFPYDLKTTASISLPALEAGTTENIIAQVENLSGQTVSPTSGMIVGQLSSEGGANGGCDPITTVVIKNKETGVNVAVIGPYYFNVGGNVVNSGSFTDSQCSYVMANVLPGVYILEFLDSSLSKQAEHEVVVLSGNVSFGLDVP